MILIYWISRDGICVEIINCILFGKGLSSNLETELCQIFDRFSGVRIFRNHISDRLGWVSVFQTGCNIMMPCMFLVRFRGN